MDFTPHTDAERKEMLDAIGVASFKDLIKGLPVTAPESKPELCARRIISPRSQNLRFRRGHRQSFDQSLKLATPMASSISFRSASVWG